ncbi:hypothetical protein BKI52_43105 [marine bacterium AO1-C]|nr:hypothetical protein BKI52_43105 [marine bacterium AO1-C]
MGIFVVSTQTSNAKPTKTILDYYNALKVKLGIHKNFKIEKQDIANGYLSVSAPVPGLPASKTITMALWRSRDGKDLIGVFSFSCSGMGCWGDLQDFKIFNADLQEVQKQALDWQILEARFKAPIKPAGAGNFPKDLVKIKVNIPQKGTTIKIYKGVMGVESKLMATLVYNYNKGTFSIL